jgi:hypothetical protein
VVVFKREGTGTPNIPILVLGNYRLNVNLMLIKHAENDLKQMMVEGIS